MLVRHEQGATHMADGYARASGRVGVAIATSGPGATNMVTGIATAMLDSSPIVCITGQVDSKLIGLDAFQEIDITGITLPITKHNYAGDARGGHRPHDARGVRRRALGPSRAGAGRHHEGRAAGIMRLRLGRGDAAASGLSSDRCIATRAIWPRAAELINSAKRPVILAGHGIHVLRRDARSAATGRDAPTSRLRVTLLGIGGVPGHRTR